MIVLKFGVRGVVSGGAAALAEMRDAHHLFNALVAIERWKRAEFAAIRSRHVAGLGEAEAAYQQLDDWIGEHAGPKGERGKIREKRRAATAASGVPTKRVDDAAELDTIAEMKAWRRAAGDIAKPLRAEFAALMGRAPVVFEARARGVPIEWLDERERLSESGESTSALAEKIEAASLKTHAKKTANARVREEMLSEPEWSEAWKDITRMEAVAYDLRAWMGDAHSLNHGTYLAVQEDVERAGKRPKPRPDGEPRKPRQRPAFSSRGLRKLGWQLQGGVTWRDILAGESGYVRVRDVRDVGGNGRKRRAIIGIRISTAERGVSQWVEVDTVIHRPVPEDTLVKWVYLVPEVHRDGRVDYSVQFTAQPSRPLVERAPGDGHAHVEFCWTQSPAGLVVARVNGMSVWLPKPVGERLAHADSLRSFAGELFDQAREVAATHGIGHYRSPDRLARVLLEREKATPGSLDSWHAWRDERLAARLDLFAPLAEVREWALARSLDPIAFWLVVWRHKDRHLRQMEQGNRDHATRRRKDFYRVVGARLSEQFGTVSFGGAVDVAALALRDKAEDRPAKELHQTARRNRVIAAVGELRECIAYAFGRERLRDAPPPGVARSGENHAGFGGELTTPEAAE